MQSVLTGRLIVYGTWGPDMWTMNPVKAPGWQEAVDSGLRFDASPEGLDWWQDSSGGRSAHHDGIEDVEDEVCPAARTWSYFQERRKAARSSMARPEDGAPGLESDMSPEGQGGGQDLPAGQSVLLTSMEDTEDGPLPEEQLLKAMEATAPLGPGKEEDRDVEANLESSKWLAPEAGG